MARSRTGVLQHVRLVVFVLGLIRVAKNLSSGSVLRLAPPRAVTSSETFPQYLAPRQLLAEQTGWCDAVSLLDLFERNGLP